MSEESPKETPEEQADTTFEHSRKEARRAQWALNSLVVLSALAGAFFFGYVLYTIQPFGGRDAEPVEIPTSSPGATLGMLSNEEGALLLVLSDIDEAPTYREQLSEVMRKDLGIDKPGRLYRLSVRGNGDADATFAPESFTLTDKQARAWPVKWLPEVAQADKATAVGKLRLAQSGQPFELATGEQRTLFVFVETGAELPPSAEDFGSGKVTLAGGGQIALEHTEVKVAGR
ncbi:MAG: hypothetical protein K8I27_09180 [Planctomycetes bacterium]|nr:hypothetical protein [Planctomycetota bacterium]